MVGTALVGEAARRHRTTPVATVALGRALMGAVLLGSSAKHDETVQLQLRGDGPLGTILAISDQHGRARGYVSHASAGLPDGRLDVGAAVGEGTLAVVRQKGNGAPYSGIVELQTGTVAEDLAHYLSESEQVRSAVGLGVFLDETGGVAAAGGFSVQALPGADEVEISKVEGNVRGFPGPGELVGEGFDAAGLAETLLIGVGIRERHSATPVFHCGCDRNRVLGAVSLLDEEELAESIRSDAPLEINCRFCATQYRLDSAELETVLAER
jgi:molecular chaperone Hsp33